MDWSDEAKARLEEEEKRLRLKAANLQERHGAWSLMAKQELVVADDIRAALEMIERPRRLGLERQEWRSRMGLSTQDDVVKRAEAAEAEVERLRKQISDNAIGASRVIAQQAEELSVLRCAIKAAPGRGEK